MSADLERPAAAPVPVDPLPVDAGPAEDPVAEPATEDPVEHPGRPGQGDSSGRDSSSEDHPDLESGLDLDSDPDSELDSEPADLEPDPEPDLDRHRVVAVMVAHNGLPWIARALDSVDAQTRSPQRRYVVDTGSTDGTAELLAARIGPGVESLPADTGFGAAVAHVLDADRHAPGLPVPSGAAGTVVDWVWLLHDDCAPEPDALRRLLTAVDSAPSVGIVGPKIVGWADPRHLLEVGVTIARGGTRETGLERREQDQGQHDQQRDVLAVSTAGMLIRRDVWDELGGLDPAFPLFRDDVDLGWRANAAGHRVVVAPDAVVHHAEAASRRRRRISAGPDQPHRLDRAHAMQVLLVNLPGWLLPWLVVRLGLGSLVRALGFLVAKDPGFAVAELRALAAVITSPGVVLRARRARRNSRVVGHRDLRRLLAAPGSQLLHGLEVLGTALDTTSRAPKRIGGLSSDSVAATAEAGGDPELEELPDDLLTGADTFLSRTLRRPGVVLTLALLVLTLVAGRALLGAGSLLGGTLLPVPDGAADLWATYTAGWHAVGVGSADPASASLPLLGTLSFVALGKVWLVVDLLLLLGVPLAGGTAYLALRGVVRSTTLRLWAALTYALLPAATGAVAGGRLGTVLVLVLLPLAARPALRLGGVLGPEPTWRTAWGTGLLLALLAAFVPSLWLLALLLTVVAAATTARGRRPILLLVSSLAVTPLVLLPWSWQLVRHPAYLFVEAGVVTPSAVASAPDPWWVLALAPGGPGTPPAWIGLGVVLAAVAAVVRGRRARAVAAAATIALVAFSLALVVAGLQVRTPQLAAAVPAWSGPLLVVAGAAAIVAALLGAEGARQMLARRSFGWQQPVAAVVAVLCLLGPLVAAVGWVLRGADGPLHRGTPTILPAFVAADAGTPQQPRSLVLRRDGAGVVAYSVVRDDGLRLGDAEAAPAASVTPGLQALVTDLASGVGGVTGFSLTPYGVRHVVVGAPGDPELERMLDAVPALRRVSSSGGESVWRVAGEVGRARLVPESGAAVVLAGGAADGVGIEAALPEDWSGGVLELAEAADRGWRATLDGADLASTVAHGWAQAFTVPAGAGTLSVRHENPAHKRWLVVQGVLVLVVVVLALPSRRRDGEGEDA